MRRNALGLSGAVTLAALTLGCGDAPTEPAQQPEVVRFALSDAEAAALSSALDDVGNRILPGFLESDAPLVLESIIGEVSAAIEARDVLALRAALKRADAALTTLTDNDRDATMAPELDAV